ncbi:MAG TPA: alpha/beta hydrolase [Cyclobacteriaceae bacterium]
MRLNIVIVVLLSGIIFSCNPKNKETETSVQSAIDTLQTTHLQIQGPAGNLTIEDGGTGGMPVIFLHSFGGSISHWKKQLQYVRENRRAIAFDFRGHGTSDLPSDNDYTNEALAKDLKAVVDSLELDRFILVGHSMGGSAAVAYVGVEPERVAGMLLVGTPGKTQPEQSDPIIKSLESDQYQAVMDQYMTRLLTNAKPDVDSVVSRDFRHISREASIALIKALFSFNPLPSLQRYAGPKLLVATTAEEQQPHTLIKQLGNVPYKIVPGTSHWIQLDKPEEFNAILDEFIKNVEK